MGLGFTMKKAVLKSLRSLENDGEEVCKVSNGGKEACKSQQWWIRCLQKPGTVEKTLVKVSNSGEDVCKSHQWWRRRLQG